MSTRSNAPIFFVAALVLLGLAAWFLFGSKDRAEGPDADTTASTPTTEREDAEGLAADTDGQQPTLVASGAEPEVPAPAPDPVESFDVWIEGRALDQRRRAVPGARIRLVASHLGDAVFETTTGDDGRYVLGGFALPPTWAPAVIHGEAPGVAGLVQVQLPPDHSGSIKARDLSLTEAHTLHGRVQDVDGAPVPGARVFLQARTPWQYGALADTRAGADGAFKFEGLPTGAYRVVGAHAGRGRGTRTLTVPVRGNEAIPLALTTPRTILVNVRDKATDEPIQGARVFVEEFIASTGAPGTLLEFVPVPATLLTDANGQLTLRDIGAEDAIQINAEADGYQGRGRGRGLYGLPTDKTEHTVKLQRTRSVRFPLAADNPHAPADGTSLTLEEAPGTMGGALPSSARIEGNELVVIEAAATHFHAVAVAPSGAYVRLFARDTGALDRELVFAMPSKITVTLKTSGGEPAVGWHVSARNQGNNAMGQPVATNETGTAVLVMKYDHLLDIYTSRSATPFGGTRIGSVDPRKTPETTLEATVPPSRPIEVTLVVDGEVKLPASFSIRGASDIEEDPEQGILRFRIDGEPDKASKLMIQAPRFLPTTLEIPPVEPGATHKARAVLSRGGSVLLRVRMPADNLATLNVTKQPGQGGGFVFTRHRVDREELGTENGWRLIRFSPLEPGTYYAEDKTSSAKSEPLVVKEGEESAVSFDLSGAGYVEGKVEVPAGYEVYRATVALDPTALSGRGFGKRPTRVGRDGTFKLRVGTAAEATVYVAHPELSPAAEGGTATINGPETGVTLHLTEGATIQFRFGPALEPIHPRNPNHFPKVTVHAMQPGEDGDALTPVHRVQAKHEAGLWTARGLPTGTYVLAIDTPNFVPLILPGTKLAKGLDLGLLTLERGASIRVKIKVPEGQDAPRIMISAHSVNPFTHWRSMNSRGEAEAVLTGLGKGTYHIRAGAVMGMGGGKQAIDESIESDGESETVFELDLSK